MQQRERTGGSSEIFLFQGRGDRHLCERSQVGVKDADENGQAPEKRKQRSGGLMQKHFEKQKREDQSV